MDLLTTRQQLTASNIANADTPGYKTKDVDFRQELSSAVGSGPNVVEIDNLPPKNDGNNVGIDREARVLAETSLRFNIAVQFTQSQLRMTRSALEEGRS